MAYAQSTITMGSGSGDPLTRVIVPLTLQNQNNMRIIGLEVVYDTSVATFFRVVPGQALKDDAETNFTQFGASGNEVEPGRVKILIVDTSTDSPVPGGEVAQVIFDLKNVPGGSSDLQMQNFDIVDVQRNPVTNFTSTNGKLEITGTAAKPGKLRFSAATYSVGEADGTATITVTRVDGTDGQVTVDYATNDGTATSGEDYTAATGTLTFADGEANKTFQITITNDSTDEPDETVNLVLRNATGGAALGTPATSSLTIKDDDQATVEKHTLTVTIQPQGYGTVTPSSGTFDEGTKVTIEAKPNQGYEFVGWAGDVPASCGKNLKCELVMNADKKVTAQFRVIIPTTTEWGMIIFMVLMTIVSIYYMRRRQMF